MSYETKVTVSGIAIMTDHRLRRGWVLGYWNNMPSWQGSLASLNGDGLMIDAIVIHPDDEVEAKRVLE